MGFLLVKPPSFGASKTRSWDVASTTKKMDVKQLLIQQKQLGNGKKLYLTKTVGLKKNLLMLTEGRM